MNERQLIILQTIIKQVKAKSRFNYTRRCFEQFAPLEIDMELVEFLELDNIETYLDDLLANIPNMAD